MGYYSSTKLKANLTDEELKEAIGDIWYILKSGDIIHKFDQYYDNEEKTWKDSKFIGYKVDWNYSTTHTYRRKINK